MPKVLILTAAYGEGHNAAARGLQSAFQELGVNAEVADPFAVVGGPSYARSRRAYATVIERAPALWATIYRLIDRTPTGFLALPFLGAVYREVRRLIESEPPLAVLSVYPLFSYCVSFLSPSVLKIPFYTVVTDSITINSIWRRCAHGWLVVPNDDSAAVLAQAGVPARRVRTMGFPVAARFARDRPARPETPWRVLYMINAGGDRAPDFVRRLLGIPGVQLTVTVGRDQELGERLARLAAELGQPLEVHGWTPLMPELLMSHHVLVGKAGGATVQETIAAGTPMLFTQIVPGQEEGNAQLLQRNRCGALCETPESLAIVLSRLFSRDGEEWKEWAANIRRLSRPDAASGIAKMVLAEASSGAEGWTAQRSFS